MLSTRQNIKNYLAMFLFSFAIIAIEIIFYHLLMIIIGYLYSTFIISIAMLGIAGGSVLGFYLLKFKRDNVLVISGLLFLFSIALSYYNITHIAIMQYPYFLILPFLFGAIIVSSIFADNHSNKVYFVNLLASGLGVIFPIFFVPWLKSENSILILMFIPIIFIFIISFYYKLISNVFLKFVSLGLGVVLIFILYFNLSLPIEISKDNFEQKILPKITDKYDKEFMQKNYHLKEDGRTYQIEAELYDQKRAKYILADIGYQPIIDINYNIKGKYRLKKLSKIYPFLNDNVYKVRFSEDSLLGRVEFLARNDKSYIMCINGNMLDDLSKGNGTIKDPRVPHLNDAKVFIVGLSADGIVKSAKKLPNAKVGGIEINPIIRRVMLEDGKFSKFSKYNIHMEYGPNSTYSPEYFHTVEGTDLLLNKITDRGFVVYEEIITNFRSKYSFVKFINTLMQSLKDRGVEDPKQHVAVFKWDFWGSAKIFRTVIVKKTPFTKKEQRSFKKYLALLEEQYQPTVLLFPRKTANSKLEKEIFTGQNSYHLERFQRIFEIPSFKNELLNKLPDEADRKALKNIYKYNKKYVIYKRPNKLNEEQKSKLAELFTKAEYPYELDVSPTYDDRPFPFDVFKQRFEIKKMAKLITILASILLIPVLLRNLRRFKEYKFSLVTQAGFFAVSGFGYMLVEIAIMQKYQRFIGSPVYSMIITLGGLLIFSGIGSLISYKFSRKQIIGAIACIPLILLIKLFFLDGIFNLFASYSFNAKLIISVLLIFPLTFLMGIPFPHAVEAVKNQKAKEYGALMFGISGAFSTIAAAVSVYTTVAYGFSTTFFIGFVAYLIGLIMFTQITKSQSA
jgi:hypothetical protein